MIIVIPHKKCKIDIEYDHYSNLLKIYTPDKAKIINNGYNSFESKLFFREENGIINNDSY